MPNELELIVDLHLRNPRQGPGGPPQTAQAIALTGLDADTPLRIADIGCGTGASTIQLAQHFTQAHTIAIDAMPLFVKQGRERVDSNNLSSRVEVREGQMESLGFEQESLDLIWSEGAIYNMGFDDGITAWRRFLKPRGVIAVSELTWTTKHRPAEIENHWKEEYPGIRSSSENVQALEHAGYAPLGFFMLPASCWEEHYYEPMERGFDAFLGRHDAHPDAQRIVDAEREEIRLYRAFGAWYSYGFYIARRVDGD